MWPHNTHTLKEFFKYNILCFVSCTAARSSLTLWHLRGFRDFWKKTPKRTWLCVGIFLVRYALQTW